MINNTGMSYINFICYSQSLTGSYNVRAYNKIRAEDSLYNQKLNSYGKYCKMYDLEGGKAAEPFFDYLAVRIATSNDDEFDKNFKYEEINFVQNRIKNGLKSQTLPENNKNLNKFLRYTTKINKTQLGLSINGTNRYLTRQQLENYKIGDHMFILGPIPNGSIKVILETIQNHVKDKKHLFIHFQGETYNNWNKNIKNYFYIDNGGLFQSAFNIQGSIFNYLKLREKLKNANKYTVIPSNTNLNNKRKPVNLSKKLNNILLNLNRISFQSQMIGYNKKPNIRGEINKSLKYEIASATPQIYKNYYKEIKYFLRTYKSTNVKNNNSQNLPSKELNIIQCHQDLYDKDNFISVCRLMDSSKIRIDMYLSGVPVFIVKNKPGFSKGPPRHRGVGLNNFHKQYAVIDKNESINRHRTIIQIWRTYMKEKGNNNVSMKLTNNNATHNKLIVNYWKTSNNHNHRNKYTSNQIQDLRLNAILFHPSIFVKTLDYYQRSISTNKPNTRKINVKPSTNKPNTPKINVKPSTNKSPYGKSFFKGEINYATMRGMGGSYVKINEVKQKV